MTCRHDARVPGTRAPAKINVTLGVLDRRPDGFHGIRSIFLALELADRLSAAVLRGPATADGAGDQLTVTGGEAVPVEGNLVLRAAAALRGHLARPLPALHFALHKEIPVAAGLGGGSSDAAAALSVAEAAWDVALAPADRSRLAEKLGSDVPFFTTAGASGWAVVSGRGEQVAPLPQLTGRLGVLLVTAHDRLSTRAVFEAYDAATRVHDGAPGAIGVAASDELAAAAREGTLSPAAVAALASTLRDANDLWPAAVALSPGLPELRDALEARVGAPFLLSGSGPTLFSLFADPDAARFAAQQLRRHDAGRSGTGTIIATSSFEAASVGRTP